MILDFKLKNEDNLVIGAAKIVLPCEDLQAAKAGLHATGQAYTACKWIDYSIHYIDNGPQECHGLMYISPCQEDS